MNYQPKRHFDPQNVRGNLNRAAIAVIVLLVVLLILDRGGYFYPEETAETMPPVISGPITRVISLAPSVTEIIYALGADSLLVGVTRYCLYPPEAKELPKIGGLLDVSLERVVELRPDLVIVLTEHDELKEKLTELGIAHLSVHHQSISGILESYKGIGKLLGSRRVADSLYTAHTERIEQARSMTGGLSRPKTLLCIGHSEEAETLEEVTVAGDEDFYTYLIEAAGGRNAFQKRGIKYPSISAEGVQAIDPEIILDMFLGAGTIGYSVDTTRTLTQWRVVSSVRAVAYGRTYILQGDRFFSPGPRFIGMLDDFLRAIHPELFSD